MLLFKLVKTDNNLDCEFLVLQDANIIFIFFEIVFNCAETQLSSPASIEEEMQQIFLPCLGYCARKGVIITYKFDHIRVIYYLLLFEFFLINQVTVKELIIHDIDVPSTIIDYILKNEMNNVVVGASHRNAFIRSLSLSPSLISL